MPISDKSKTLLWTILSSCVYCGGFLGLLALAAGGWRKNDFHDTSGRYLILALLFLIGFPFVQYFISKELGSSGNFQAATGVGKSILIEIVLLFLLLVFISQIGR